MEAQDSPLPAVDKALRALEVLSDAGPAGLQLGALAETLGLHKPSVHRTLAALAHRGYVDRTGDGAYRLGAAALALGATWAPAEHLPALVHPALVALCEASDELVHLGVLVGADVLYLDKVEPERPVRVWSAVGRRRPAARTALGRALLALGPSSVPDASPADAAAIARAREAGYAVEREENEPGIACVGLALVRAGAPVGALSVTVPAERMSAERPAELAGLARAVVPPLLPPGLALAGTP
ncbi:Glycerol operon regulatory protein [Luteimicrobium xylanilyticum]|uniref:Glycerol operon regulatory protein n=1 Tax=Luteimicrobium xylanilyticum TaxID=1133546 RepID=A0A5P9Q8C6_9MICO|nr:IclR family transcriptional regulator [Luteimicrobium xylanilyticum]QFU97536.1 Glycerol operon regulatory protein [Luteimicrobium xylanilyticum]